MGYPVVASIFGHQAVFYAAVLNVVNTFAVFTIGTILVVGDLGDGKRFQKKVLYSTPMLSAYLAMLIVALGIDNIPGSSGPRCHNFPSRPCSAIQLSISRQYSDCC